MLSKWGQFYLCYLIVIGTKEIKMWNVSAKLFFNGALSHYEKFTLCEKFLINFRLSLAILITVHPF
jgi:hypothetical protein